MTRRIAHEALIALEFHGLPFHDPFHGHAVGRRWPPRDQGRICSGRDALQGAGIWRAAVRMRTRDCGPFDEPSLGYEHYDAHLLRLRCSGASR